MLILCPQKDKKSGEYINDCVAHHMGLFQCGHISILWDETRYVVSRKSSTPPPASSDGINKSIQDTGDEDNWRTVYARAVKPFLVVIITKHNRDKVTDKYPDLIPPTNGVSHIPEHPPSACPTTPYHELPGDIITSICQQNRGKANGLFMDSLDIFIPLATKDNASIHK